MKPFLKRDPDSYCFSPKESVEWRRAQASAARKTPLSCGNKRGTNVKKAPHTTPGDCYTTHSYGKAIRRACIVAKIEPWAPNRIRHSVATKVRKEFGLDAAATVLGHANVEVTQVYAEQDRAKARQVMQTMG